MPIVHHSLLERTIDPEVPSLRKREQGQVVTKFRKKSFYLHKLPGVAPRGYIGSDGHTHDFGQGPYE
jgi:hypothetical protein